MTPITLKVTLPFTTDQTAKTELSVQSLIGTGKAPLYTGATVYNLDEVVVQQHKLELKRGGLKAKFFFTHENAGNTSVTQLDAVNVTMPSLRFTPGWGYLPSNLFRWDSFITRNSSSTSITWCYGTNTRSYYGCLWSGFGWS